MVASGQLLSRIRSSSPPGSIEAITPEPSDTARIYKRAGHAGSFGFISSMTDHFCSGCSRLRLGADGSMKVSRKHLGFFPRSGSSRLMSCPFFVALRQTGMLIWRAEAFTSRPFTLGCKRLRNQPTYWPSCQRQEIRPRRQIRSVGLGSPRN